MLTHPRRAPEENIQSQSNEVPQNNDRMLICSTELNWARFFTSG